MTDYAKAFELLFQSPTEPIYTCKDNGKAMFVLPASYYNDDEEVGISELLETLYLGKKCMKISLEDLLDKPDLSFADCLSKRQQFSIFNVLHRQAAGKLIELLLDATHVEHFLALCVYARHRLNPMLFQYGYAVALQHRADTRDIWIPPVAEIFPTNFIEPSTFQEARIAAVLTHNNNNNFAEPQRHIIIPNNYTASDREMEQRLAYFREDIGVNMHHWHWHLVYPHEGPEQVVCKDRRGELFYYMHQQIMARYNAERFCNNLSKTLPLNDLRAPIAEGYFPKLLNSANNRTYPSRANHQRLSDLNRENALIDIAEVERWCDRIHDAIDQGFVVDLAGARHQLDALRGIDLLGNIIEASALSINPQYYGNLHNTGHNLIACAHDPDHRHLEGYGVMGDNTTAMRDPVFYRWHGYINNIFGKFKTLLPPYDASALSFCDVHVQHVEVITTATTTATISKPNHLTTFWQCSAVDLAAGLDFAADSGIFASYKHLQHAPFSYNIVARNASTELARGTCRIFLCPQVDERGTALSLEEQRGLAIELDKFCVALQPGENYITRHSHQSAVTVAFERTFRRPALGNKAQPQQPTLMERLARLHFCGCGWPHHLLLPKGKAHGMHFDLFVMISDYADDAVQQCEHCAADENGAPIDDAADTNAAASKDSAHLSNSALCGDDAASYCGLRDKFYPDRRTMGFPFDRRLPGADLQALTARYSNMQAIDVVITFEDEVRQDI